MVGNLYMDDGYGNRMPDLSTMIEKIKEEEPLILKWEPVDYTAWADHPTIKYVEYSITAETEDFHEPEDFGDDVNNHENEEDSYIFVARVGRHVGKFDDSFGYSVRFVDFADAVKWCETNVRMLHALPTDEFSVAQVIDLKATIALNLKDYSADLTEYQYTNLLNDLSKLANSIGSLAFIYGWNNGRAQLKAEPQSELDTLPKP